MSEAEYCALFENAQMGAIIRPTLEELGHPQPPTPIRTDNTTAAGIVNNTIKQNRSCTIDMRVYWVKDRASRKQFLIYWDRGDTNMGDYFTKHHPSWHCIKMRPIVLNNTSNSHFESGKGVLVMSSRAPLGPRSVTVTKAVTTQIQTLVAYLKQFNQRLLH